MTHKPYIPPPPANPKAQRCAVCKIYLKDSGWWIQIKNNVYCKKHGNKNKKGSQKGKRRV